MVSNTMLIQITTILLFPILSYQLQLPFKFNKPKVITEEIHRCANQGSKDIVWDLKMKRLSRDKLVVEGNISMNIPMDDKVGGITEVAEKSNGGWIQRGYVFKIPHYCKDIQRSTSYWWNNFWESAGIPPPITCPIPKGKYILKNFAAAQDINLVPGIKYGTFKVKIQFVNKNSSVLGCIEFIMRIASEGSK